MIRLLGYQVRELFRDKRGDLPAGVWVIGAAVLSVVMIAGLISVAPGTVTAFWNKLTQFATDKFF